jgi:hypothetical protein
VGASRLGSALLVLGLFVGALAALGMVIGFRPSQLPAALLDLAAYKLALAASLGLLGAGALFLRHANRAQARQSASSLGLPSSPSCVDGPASDGTGRDPVIAAHTAFVRSSPDRSTEALKPRDNTP